MFLKFMLSMNERIREGRSCGVGVIKMSKSTCFKNSRGYFTCWASCYECQRTFYA